MWHSKRHIETYNIKHTTSIQQTYNKHLDGKDELKQNPSCSGILYFWKLCSYRYYCLEFKTQMAGPTQFLWGKKISKYFHYYSKIKENLSAQLQFCWFLLSPFPRWREDFSFILALSIFDLSFIDLCFQYIFATWI